MDTTDVDGLTEIVLAEDGTTSTDMNLGVAAGVAVSLVESDDEVLTITVDGAATDDAASLDFNIGGTAAVDGGAFTAANIQNLNIMSVGSAANTLGAATTGALENLMVTADQDFTATSFTMAAGEAVGTYDTFTVATSGEADIDLGDLTTAANINQIAFSSEGEGDRAFTIAAIAGLKTDIGDDEAGVDITGAGTGTVEVTATGAFLNTLRIDGSAFDGSVEAIASAANAIDADNFTGVDTLNFGANMGGVAISKLDADVVAKVGFAQTLTQVITGSTTSRDVLFSLNAGTAGAIAIANALTIADAKTINFSTENTHATGTAQTYTLTTLTNAGAANVVNVEAANMIWSPAYGIFPVC